MADVEENTAIPLADASEPDRALEPADMVDVALVKQKLQEDQEDQEAVETPVRVVEKTRSDVKETLKIHLLGTVFELPRDDPDQAKELLEVIKAGVEEGAGKLEFPEKEKNAISKFMQDIEEAYPSSSELMGQISEIREILGEEQIDSIADGEASTIPRPQIFEEEPVSEPAPQTDEDKPPPPTERSAGVEKIMKEVQEAEAEDKMPEIPDIDIPAPKPPVFDAEIDFPPPEPPVFDAELDLPSPSESKTGAIQATESQFQELREKYKDDAKALNVLMLSGLKGLKKLEEERGQKKAEKEPSAKTSEPTPEAKPKPKMPTKADEAHVKTAKPSSGKPPVDKAVAPVVKKQTPDVQTAKSQTTKTPTDNKEAEGKIDEQPNAEVFSEQEREQMINDLMKRLGQPVTSDESAVIAIKAVLMEKIETEEDIKMLEAYLKRGKSLEEIDEYILNKNKPELEQLLKETKAKLNKLPYEIKVADRKYSTKQKEREKEKTDLRKEIKSLKSRYAPYENLTKEERNALSADKSKEMEGLKKKIADTKKQFKKLDKPPKDKKRDALYASKTQLAEYKTQLTDGLNRFKERKGEETEHYGDRPEKLLGMILWHFAGKELLDDETPDYKEVVKDTQERLEDAQQKKFGYIRKAWLGLGKAIAVVMPLNYLLKPTLTGTLEAVVEKDKALKEVKPEDAVELAKLWRNPQGVETWIQNLGGKGKEKENMQTVVPVLISHLSSAINAGGFASYLNTASIIQARGLLKLLRERVHDFSMEQAKSEPGKSPEKMTAYFNNLNEINRKEDKHKSSIVFWNAQKVGAIRLAKGAALGMTGGAAYVGTYAAVTALAALSTTALAAGGLAAGGGAALGGSFTVKDAKTKKDFRNLATRGLVAGGLGALALGTVPWLAIPAMAGGFISKDIVKHRAKIKKYAPPAGAIGVRLALAGAGALLSCGVLMFSKRFRNAFGIHLRPYGK